MITAPHLHALVIHFPIALLIAAFLAELLSLAIKKDFFRNTSYFLLILGTIGAIVAYSSGSYASEGMTDGIFEKPLDLHEDAATITLWLAIFTTLFKTVMLFFTEEKRWLKWLGFMLFAFLVTSVARTGYLGGQLVFKHGAGIELSLPDFGESEIPTSDSETTVKTAVKDPKEIIIQNMHDAYKGETTAHFKYAAYSKKAFLEGHPEIALLFKAASGAELIHANNHKVVLIRMGEKIPEIKPVFEVNSTLENLQESIKGESYEFNTMYPEFIKNANSAGNYMAQISLTYAYKVERKHRDFYIEALASLESGTDNKLANVYYLCPTCGNTYATTAPSRCEISMTDSKLFIKVDSL
ncbi:MAG: DUF2231 domain-containing protein [Bacteroidota bacterium]